MIEYTQHMNKTIPLEDRAKYNDWVIDQLDPEPARWGLPLKAISLAMANGDLKDWHLEWLGNNIPHLKKLRNGYARKKNNGIICRKWNNTKTECQRRTAYDVAVTKFNC